MRKIKIDFEKGDGLIPAIIQDFKSKDVLMLGFMSDLAFKKTIEKGFVFFWSRKRQKLWMKGETSGNKLKVIEILKDCDNDTILIKAELIGENVCHKETKSCFRKLDPETSSG